jgi:hypothetical protein
MSTGYLVYLPAKFDILRLGCAPNDLACFSDTNIQSVLTAVARLKADKLIDDHVLDNLGALRFLAKKFKEAGLVIAEWGVDGNDFIKAFTLDEKNRFIKALADEGLSDKSATMDKVETLLSDIVARLRQGAQEIASDLGVDLKDIVGDGTDNRFENE